jgi:dethiobiotin synthetase
MARAEDNIATLRERLRAPCLGVLPHAPAVAPSRLTEYLAGACDMLTQQGGGV